MFNDHFSGTNARNGRRSSRAPRIFFLLALLIIALSIATLARSPASGLLWQATVPVKSVFGYLGGVLNNIGTQFKTKVSLAELNTELQQRLEEAQARVADRDILYEENIMLKQQFGRPDAARGGILVAVIARPPATAYDTLILDVGKNLDVSVGNFVSAGGGALIGQITDVYATTARAALFSTAGSSYQGLLRGEIPVEVEGQGAGALSAKVPAGTPVAVGDAIRLPGIAANVSEIVSSIDAPQSNSFKTLYLHLPANIFTLRYVEILP